MKQKYTVLIKGFRLLFLLCITLLFTNCEKDDVYHKEALSEEKLDILVKNVSLSEIQEDALLSSAIENIETRFDYVGKKGAASKIKPSDGGFTILTDEIVKITKNHKTTYTFRIETPTDQRSTFENFVIKKLNSQKIQFYIYRYKENTGDYSNYMPYIITREKVDSNQINEGAFDGYLNKVLYDSSSDCYFDVSKSGNLLILTVLACGDSGSSDMSVGSSGGSYSDWVYYNPDGVGDCLRYRGYLDANGEPQYQVEPFSCPDDDTSSSNDGPDDPWSDSDGSNSDPLHDGDSGTGGGGSSSNGDGSDDSTVGVLPQKTTADELAIALNITEFEFRQTLYSDDELADLLFSLCMANNFSNQAKAATLMTVYTKSLGKIQGPFDNTYYNKVIQQLSITGFTSDIDLTNPAIREIWQYHYTTQRDFLKTKNPSWSNTWLYWQTTMDMLSMRSTYKQVKTFLANNGNSLEAKALAREAVESLMDKVCLSSFQFTNVGSNWQNAGLSNVNVQFLTIGKVIAIQNVHFPELHFGLPKELSNGEYITNNNAKYVAEEIMTEAEQLTNSFQSNNPTATANQLKYYFLEQMQNISAQHGGTVGTSPPLGWIGPLKPHKAYIISSFWECD
ncbi:hypothetical protein OOZ15_11580 [Galbibacter sp. EGI 63066]|uniref:hypothetical protein n=1 Tax=Galbibacter sp. EGI 63066 TaxID=2993559 RepID=UPI0022491CA5|nr:hypothetical protein [Galbibacter sp. EGI 63066]MCX2680583.1 hypothetical protein [Galbibacter sp. EGI 63066]